MAMAEPQADRTAPAEMDPELFAPLEAALLASDRPLDIERVRSAYELAAYAHRDQTRRSGEPYITHPIAVASILAKVLADTDVLCAALLHDVLEDCPEVTPKDIESKFGPVVLALIDGVTKLKPSPQKEVLLPAAENSQQAETLRKMVMAMSKDIRVMFIKLADRLHNMMTLGAMPEAKRIRIAQETLDIYAPIAARLGIYQFKWQLEDLSFKYLHPDQYRKIHALVGRTRFQREAQIEEIISRLTPKFEELGVRPVEIKGRPKHLFSIFNKMVKHKIAFDDIYDLLAIRIIVRNVNEAYVAYGAVRSAFHSFEDRKHDYDYIASPKPNGYQSIHLKVLSPRGVPFEVQIRTEEMHRVAEMGFAAHWTYKEGKASRQEQMKMENLRSKLEGYLDDGGSGSEFLDHLNTDFLAEQVWVWTPKGRVIELPRGSTAIDFAFAIHSEMGLKVIGAKVNGQIVDLAKPLETGQTVELLTRGAAKPSPDWLEFVKTTGARQKLRSYFRKQNREEHITQGRKALEREAEKYGLPFRERFGDETLAEIARTINDCVTAEDIFAKIGNGLISAQSIVDKVRGSQQARASEATPFKTIQRPRGAGMEIATGDLKGMAVSRANCCRPVPGEEVVGYTSQGRGFILHRPSCPEIASLRKFEPGRVTIQQWVPTTDTYPVSLRIECVDKSGVSSDVMAVFASLKANLSAAKIDTRRHPGRAIVAVDVDVTSITQLESVMTRLESIQNVLSVQRRAQMP